jgi:hypothetical protein
MAQLIPLYLRTEPTAHSETLKLWPKTTARDVVAYRDADCTKQAVRWSWYRKKPDRRNKRVTLNCYQWDAVWLPPLKKTEGA